MQMSDQQKRWVLTVQQRLIERLSIDVDYGGDAAPGSLVVIHPSGRTVQLSSDGEPRGVRSVWYKGMEHTFNNDDDVVSWVCGWAAA